jgi:hypothetical protein
MEGTSLASYLIIVGLFLDIFFDSESEGEIFFPNFG